MRCVAMKGYGLTILASLLILQHAQTACLGAAPEYPVMPNTALQDYKSRATKVDSGKQLCVKVELISELDVNESKKALEHLEDLVQVIQTVFHGLTAREPFKRLQLWIVDDRNEYLSAVKLVGHADGAGSGGMACRDDDEVFLFSNGYSWRTIQHECWHAVAGTWMPKMPSWFNEGLAEVFERGEYVADSFMIGNLSKEDIDRVNKAIQDGSFEELPIFFQRGGQWGQRLKFNHYLAGVQYLQAWALMHYLLFGDEGEHTQQVNALIRSLNSGESWRSALNRSIGSDNQSIADLEAAIIRYYQQATPVDLASIHEKLVEWGAGFSEGWAVPPRMLEQDGDVVYIPGSPVDSLREAHIFDDLQEAEEAEWVSHVHITQGRAGNSPQVEIDGISGLHWTVIWKWQPSTEIWKWQPFTEHPKVMEFVPQVTWGISG